MAHIRNLSSRAYISNSLKESLGRFEMYRYSFIYAPTGYGKSKVCKTFFKNYSGYTVLWIQFWITACPTRRNRSRRNGISISPTTGSISSPSCNLAAVKESISIFSWRAALTRQTAPDCISVRSRRLAKIRRLVK